MEPFLVMQIPVPITEQAVLHTHQLVVHIWPSVMARHQPSEHNYWPRFAHSRLPLDNKLITSVKVLNV